MPAILRSLTLAALVLAPSTLALAQEHATWRLQDKPAGVLPIDLVTVSQPTVRHKCRVHSITANAITCGVGFARKPVVYDRDNVAALILPPNHATRFDSIAEITVAAACLAGSFFVPIAPLAIVLRVASGLIPVAVLGNFFDDDDHNDDQLLYQRPNTPLTVTLRTH